MKIALCFLLLPIAVLAAPVDGTVVNGKTGKPQPNTTVSLFRVGANGPESLESVKSDAEGKFNLSTDIPGPRLIQVAYDGVTYNRMIPPGTPSSGITIDVFPSAKEPGGARIDQHMMFLDPAANGQMTVSEMYIWENNGKTTFNNPDKGTLQFYVPPETKGQVSVSVLAPQGMPIRRPADKTATPDVYKVDFPIKPGQSRVEVSYTLPFTSPGEFSSKVFTKGIPTRVVAAPGVTLSGEGLQNLGKGPMDSVIYSTDAPAFRVQVAGTAVPASGGAQGDTQSSGGGDQSSGGGGGQIAQILPKLFQHGDPNGGFGGSVNAVKWILLLAFGILGLAFTILYRSGTGAPVITGSAKGQSERSRR